MKTYRKLDKLTPNFRKKVEAFINEVGGKIFITESYRSKNRQKYLYSLGRTRKGRKVTWTINSMHTKGLAIDIAFLGKKLYPNDIYSWKEIAEIANKYGIDWGYDLWKSDKPHFQDNGKPFKKESPFLENSKFGKFIKTDQDLLFNDYKDTRIATIADVKELLTIFSQKKTLK